MPDSVPRLFDAALARRSLARARPEPSQFLASAIAGQIAERVDLIRRDFPLTLVHGLGSIETASRLASIARFRTIIASGPVPAAEHDVVFEAEALPFADRSFDCIVSLLTLQSVNDLPGSLVQMRRALTPDGLLLACLFGGATLFELRSAWLEAENEERGGVTPRIAPLADLRELGMLLQRAGFALPVTDTDRVVVRYPDALSLMREVKALGLGNALAGRSRRPVTPALLAKAAAIYGERFSDPDGRVRSTVEIAWLTAWAPDPSQPRPLKPGSAKARLANALGTSERNLPRE